ncbi:MAG TPA: serine/threonine-protein kinase [Polyangia bacterium]|jgi:tRNA A-37 threonylcarbamoyl transferase component Bud32
MLDRGPLLAAIYIYGHLVAATFSLAMALAFAVSALRVPGARADWWTAFLFLLTASTGTVEMLLALRPSLELARALIAAEGLLIFFVGVSFHAQFGAEVLSPVALARHRLAILGYAAWCCALVILIIGGVLDDGVARPIAVAGIHSTAMVLPTPAFIVCLAYVCTGSLLSSMLLLPDGPRRGERRMLAIPLCLLPLIGIYELTIGFGVNPYVPVGGYFASLSGIIGAFVLAERFRSLVGGSSVVGSYTILGRLGSGGMADVYLAQRSGSGGVVQRVALKRLRPEHLDDPSFARMFLDEARIAARLVHPNIVTLLDVGEHGSELYLAMELVDGAPLSRMLGLLRRRGTPLGDAAAVEIALQIADALAYAHAMTDDAGRPLRLVHRDVSPHNVLVDKTGHVRLTDFGIARFLDEGAARTRTGMMKGKLSYMAPEQVQSSTYDQRIDVYALGVVLFEMLANRLPYAGSSEPTVLRRLMENDPEPWRRAAGLSAPLGPIVRAATNPQPKERTPSAAELRDALLPLRDESRARAELSSLVADAIAAAELRDAQEAPTVANAK